MVAVNLVIVEIIETQTTARDIFDPLPLFLRPEKYHLTYPNADKRVGETREYYGFH